MQEDFEKLVGVQSEKPFECVGSRDEVNAAVCLAIERMEQEEAPLPVLFAWYRKQQIYAVAFPKRHSYDRYYDPAHLLPESFLALLTEACYGGKLPC